MKLSEKTYYVGVNDKQIDLFEGQYAVPNGMAYNSYLLVDEKVAVLDSVDNSFSDEWLGNIEAVLKDRAPEYLIVQHMEPDHSGSITAFAERYPQAKILSSMQAFVMMKNFFAKDYSDRRIVVKDGDTLELGKHKLTFIAAPMVHWPEVTVTYDEGEKTLFSADAFGKFGTLDTEEEWACEARRYYTGIVGKYGVQVQNLLKKVKALDVQRICPLHGPVLEENLEYYFRLYDIWSSYGVESEGIAIAYTSVYGHTKEAAEKLARLIQERGCKKVVLNDLARCDMAEAVEDAFRYGTVVFATTTYNGEIFPFMRDFLNRLVEHNFQKKRVGFIENGSWAPVAARTMRGILEKCKDLVFTQTSVKILSALNEESEGQLVKLADELTKE